MEKKTLLNRICLSKDVGQKFDQLRQLISLEDFKQCAHADIRTYLIEQKVDLLQ